MQKFYILDDKMNPVECSEIQHLTWIRDHGHIPILATIGFRYQIVADMRRSFCVPPMFEVRLNGDAGTTKLVLRSWKFSEALQHVLSLMSDDSNPDPQPEPTDKPYVTWKDDKVVPATLDEAMDWIVKNPLNEFNLREHGHWTTFIDFDVDDMCSGLPFTLTINNDGAIHSRIFMPTFTDAVSAQNKFHAKLEGK